MLTITCSEEKSTNQAFSYFPDATILKKGVVNKYYEHYYPNDPNSEIRTNIFYTLIQKTSENSYTSHRYNAGFELKDYDEFLMKGALVLLDSSLSFYSLANLDTVISEIRSPIFEIWEEPSGEGLLEFMDYDGDQYEIEKVQKRILDTLIMGKPAKVLIGERNVKSFERDTIFRYKYASTYIQGIGLWSHLSTRQNGRFATELVEQMPMSRFRKLASHDKKRVAYIDPYSTIDDATNFVICGPEKGIADYYNARKEVRYADSKGEMMRIIRSNTEREKLMGDSGYLTFRFVVNCRGEAGRFVMEQTSLDYEDKEFSKETVDHLYQITYSFKRWRPAVIREEPRDAYVYVTYKLQNGVITDVLP